VPSSSSPRRSSWASSRGVLHREKFRRSASEAEVEAYVELLRRESIVIDDPEPTREPLTEDPDDEYLIALARAARVEVLVSGISTPSDCAARSPVLTPRECVQSLQHR
jgi:predicted nucleic acid-binding protein